jgi:hypothetical protein
VRQLRLHKSSRVHAGTSGAFLIANLYAWCQSTSSGRLLFVESRPAAAKEELAAHLLDSKNVATAIITTMLAIIQDRTGRNGEPW